MDTSSTPLKPLPGICNYSLWCEKVVRVGMLCYVILGRQKQKFGHFVFGQYAVEELNICLAKVAGASLLI